MKLSRTISIALFAALTAALSAGAFPFSLGTSVRTAHAASSANAASCTITTDDLATVKAAAENGLLAELAARRTLLSHIITCAQNDATSLQNELNGISVSGNDAQTIQSQLSGKLGDAVTYYGLELAKVPTAGIAGTQAIAKEVLSWRASNYEPLAEQVKNFELWEGSQPLFSAADARLSGIASLVGFIEQAGANIELQSDLSAAQSLMQTAKNENGAAEGALAQFLPPDQVRADIQQSLQSLSDTYQKFFDIANTIQSLLPSSSGSGGSGTQK